LKRLVSDVNEILLSIPRSFAPVVREVDVPTVPHPSSAISVKVEVKYSK
jgi:hypothetical protein